MLLLMLLAAAGWEALGLRFAAVADAADLLLLLLLLLPILAPRLAKA